VIIGSGVFGIGAAIEFHGRGYKNITVVDPSAKVGPNPLASSTDISKIIRSDYGTDLEYPN
jgi:NADPH-dependent 2,4-dienoyl-CoA reductase/sulfur reductase-like enzyme